MIFIILIQSKNKKTIILLFSILCLLLNKLKLIKKIINKNITLTKFAILKSPFIFKTAQQHFGFKFYRKKLILNKINFYKFILFIKLFINRLLYSISLIIYYNFTIKNSSCLIKNYNIYIFKLMYPLNLLVIEKKMNYLLKQIIKILNLLNVKIIHKLIYYS